MARVLIEFVLPIVLSVYALVDCVQTPDEDVRHLPKFGWIVLIVLAPLVGALTWLIAGRQRGQGWASRQTTAPPPLAPDDNPDFLNRLGDEARRKQWKQRKDDPEAKPGS